MADDAPFLPGLSPVAGKPVQVTFDAGRLTSDGGVLVLAELERRLGIAERLARCLEDPRAPERVTHRLAEMIRFRALLIAAGYPDANDCDTLRADPAFKLGVGRLPESGADLCSQPTISRLENLPGPRALKRMMATMIVELARPIDSRDRLPARLAHRVDAPLEGLDAALQFGPANHGVRLIGRWPKGQQFLARDAGDVVVDLNEQRVQRPLQLEVARRILIIGIGLQLCSSRCTSRSLAWA